MRRKHLEGRLDSSRVLRLVLCVAACALVMMRADNRTAHAETVAVAEDGGLSCSEAIAAPEVSFGIPPGLLHAVARVESGRRDPKTGGVVAWPWTLNVMGESQYHASKVEALTALQRLQDRGIENVDVGCMQINLHYHQGVFTSMEQALDPKRNVRYGASFLRALYAATGSWSTAVSRYHSATPHLGEAYETRVMAAWRGLGGRQSVMRLPPATTAAGRYVRAEVIARALIDAGLPVQAEILYLQMRRGRSPSSTPPRKQPDGLRTKTDEGPGNSVMTAREHFSNPWASPTREEDSVLKTRSQSHSGTIGHRASRARTGVTKYERARNDRMQSSAPTSRFDRRRGVLW